MDDEKPPLSEESWMLEKYKIECRNRGEIFLTPLIFSVGGTMSPDTKFFLRTISQAYGEESIMEEQYATSTYARTVAITLSYKLMRACVRMVSIGRAKLRFCNPISHTYGQPEPEPSIKAPPRN